MSVIEDFKLDMADEFDISYAKANTIFQLLVDLLIEQAPGRIARNRMLNAVAKTIESDYTETVNNFKKVLDHEAEIKSELKDLADARAVAAADRNWKRIEKIIHELARGEFN